MTIGYPTILEAQVPAAGALSPALGIADKSSGLLLTPAALDALTVVGFDVADAVGGTYVPLRDSAGALVQIAVDVASANAYPIPAAVFSAAFVKLRMQIAAGTDQVQAADRDFKLVLQK